MIKHIAELTKIDDIAYCGESNEMEDLKIVIDSRLSIKRFAEDKNLCDECKQRYLQDLNITVIDNRVYFKENN